MRILLVLLLGIILNACSTTEERIDISSAERAFNEAKEYEDEKRFEESLRRYEEIKSKFPYSNFARESDLRIAEVYFKREEFNSAALAYTNFKFLHPNHPQIPYVSLQLALSYFNQLPPTIDRDLSVGHTAIQEFDVVIQKYPNSQYATTAKEKKAAVEKMLLEKEHYIGNFYFKREDYMSALKRFENLQTLPGPEEIKIEALYKGAISAFESGELGRGATLINRLEERYPKSSYAQDIPSIKAKYGIR